jgi:HSP20 family protein
MTVELKEMKRRIAADMCSCVNEETDSIHLEFTIPGVKREDIKLKLLDESFSLSAMRDDAEYVSTGSFCCPVKAKDSKANYENGLLMLDIPFKDPWAGAMEVAIG